MKLFQKKRTPKVYDPNSLELQDTNRLRLIEVMRAELHHTYQQRLAACMETANQIAQQQALPGRVTADDMAKFDERGIGATWSEKVALYTMWHIHGID